MSGGWELLPQRASLIVYAGVGIAKLVQGMLDYLFWLVGCSHSAVSRYAGLQAGADW